MKFSALAVLALAAGANADFPEGFVQQCCVGVSPPADFGAAFDVAGYPNEECIGLGGGGCMGLQDLCDDIGSGLGIAPGALVPCPGEAEHCCRADDMTVLGDIDIYWHCAGLIGWSTSSIAGPIQCPNPADASSCNGSGAGTGYWCGLQVQCKFGDLTGLICGDPHVRTWGGEWYDFDGECDMKYLENKEFNNGLGMSIHIRTKGRYEYSYVESAAIKIGDDILEVGSFGEYYFNGVQSADLSAVKIADIYSIEYNAPDKKNHIFKIKTGVNGQYGEEAVILKSFKDMVSVGFENAYETSFGQSVGMLGDYQKGLKYGRDGKTIIEDATEFGMEWQVLPEEDKLFQANRGPQLPEQKCIMPSKNASVERRRLGEGVTREVAEAACSKVDTVHHENCVYDVMATGDIEAVHAGVF